MHSTNGLQRGELGARLVPLVDGTHDATDAHWMKRQPTSYRRCTTTSGYSYRAVTDALTNLYAEMLYRGGGWTATLRTRQKAGFTLPQRPYTSSQQRETDARKIPFT